MEHLPRDGESRILEECTYPRIAPCCVSLIITDLAVIGVTGDGLELKEVGPDGLPRMFRV
jgi:3-oxoacid CoA-transferase subunit B